MIIIQDTTGLVVKETIDATDHVRIDVTQTALWKGGILREVLDVGKPYCELTINEFRDLLAELRRII